MTQALPRPRGTLSTVVLAALAGTPGGLDYAELPTVCRPVYLDEDAMVTLYAAYELHYRGLAGVDEAWEWDPGLLRVVRHLESALERDLRELVGAPAPASDVVTWLAETVAADDGPSLAAYVQKRATLQQAREYFAHRSVVQLKEADPQSWLVPRLAGQAKGTAVQVQSDEYGGGDLRIMHSELWAAAMRGAGMDDAEGSAVDRVPAISLAILNAQTMFGLHRRLRGAGAGFFTVVEMTSSIPMRRYARGMRRLGLGEDVQRYFLEHVEADALHEQLMLREFVAPLVATEPEQVEQVMFGALTCLRLDAVLAEHVIGAWEAGRSSLTTAGDGAAGGCDTPGAFDMTVGACAPGGVDALSGAHTSGGCDAAGSGMADAAELFDHPGHGSGEAARRLPAGGAA